MGAVMPGREERSYFGNDKLDWFRQYLPFEVGIPSDQRFANICA
jgi:hypothetical protein